MRIDERGRRIVLKERILNEMLTSPKQMAFDNLMNELRREELKPMFSKMKYDELRDYIWNKYFKEVERSEGK
jgi:hypothetical protein